MLGVVAVSGAGEPNSLPAFPGAEGCGTTTPGGRGGRVIEVVNLNDSGPGSLRAACEAEGPRIVVFQVTGLIALEKPIIVTQPFMTLAAQTAPGDGVCLRNYSLAVATHDVVVRYLRSRVGDQGGRQEDALTLAHGASRAIFDHCSASWSIDEALSLAGNVSDVTVQWCLIAEALDHSKHPKGAHGYGTLCRANGPVSLHHNLWAHNDARNPRLGDSYGRPPYPTFDFRNNVIYDYGKICSGLTQGRFGVNYIANYIRSGPSSRAEYPITVGVPSQMRFFIRDNVVEGNDLLTRDNALFFSRTDANGVRPVEVVAEPFRLPPVRTESAQEAYDLVLADVGASLPVRDAVDARLIDTVRNRTGSIIDSQEQVGGWPTYRAASARRDSDHDGMPDEWETRYGLDPNDPSDGPADKDKDGYTNVEEYLNGTEPTQYIDYRHPGNNRAPLAAAAQTPAGLHRDIEYGRVGDERLLLDVSVPQDEALHPVAVIVHGGGWGSGDKQRDHTMFLGPLTRAGFTWFAINYRLAPQYRWPACFDDVRTALRWIRMHAARYKGDPRRIAVIGYSAGAQLACLAVVEAAPDAQVAAVVGLAAPTDLETDTERRGGLSVALKDLLNRQDVNDEVRALLRDLSPVNHLKAGLPPFLLVHGTADRSVPYGQSVGFQARLKALGVACDLITIDNAPHSIKEWSRFDPDYVGQIIDWLTRTMAE
jgi:acetyl esterase/lipase